jgi:hypothetical protein
MPPVLEKLVGDGDDAITHASKEERREWRDDGTRKQETMYDQMGSVVSPLSKLIRPTAETPKDVRRTSDGVRASHPLALTGEERWAGDQQSYVPPPKVLFCTSAWQLSEDPAASFHVHV